LPSIAHLDVTKITLYYNVTKHGEIPMPQTTQASMSMRLPQELLTQLEELAEATGRSKSYIATQALREYVALHACQVAEIKKALEEVEAGDFASDEEMDALDRKYGYHGN
jgi:predicted transcriptional regulator